ncbi:SDR family NAD(P)-dependent oxidoreductase [Actinocorallia sp. API 0066]|uniref:SDR family NAD(P)-dependent oxidoreductase n=1 Tax=Actinocorallia sp. API 0066 TaxID=2896846 RepID=UPI001E2851AE|nr:SDR family NAD(P)-dependent oxidoreductase [Actinocorallia sp. API 0066]MCD0450487.1 SDR family NAD(P)-dependent oxidoreductase [Actinocorallia sp. API 0066]
MNAQRTVVITGGSRGLGYQAAKVIAAERGWCVAIAGRNRAATVAAADRLSAETGGRVVPLDLDLASLADVRRFVRELPLRELPPVHSLVCNAGVQFVSDVRYTDDGFEETFAVNHLAHFLLANLMLSLLQPPGRIVFVASDTHDPARKTGMPAPRYTDAQSLARPVDPEGGNLHGRIRYTTSKLCNVLTAYELDRRLDTNDGVTVNAFDPGMMPGSGLARDYGAFQRFGWRFVLPALTVLPLNIHTQRRSGRALARLVLDPALETTSGRYFEGFTETRSSTDSYNLDLAADLWNTSSALTDLTRPVP